MTSEMFLLGCGPHHKADPQPTVRCGSKGGHLDVWIPESNQLLFPGNKKLPKFLTLFEFSVESVGTWALVPKFLQDSGMKPK